MLAISGALQARLTAVAQQYLGPDGAALLEAAAHQATSQPFAKVTYTQLPGLLDAMGRGATAADQTAAAALGDALDQLRDDVEAGLGGRIIGLVGKRLGPAAEPFLRRVCEHLGMTLERIDRARLPALAQAVRADSVALVGEEVADAAAAAVLEAGGARPKGLPAEVLRCATEHLGASGESVVRRICRERVGVEVDEIDAIGLGVLAQAVRAEAPRLLAALHTEGFVLAARQAAANPASPLHAQVIATVSRHLGPAGAGFIQDVAAKHGLPWKSLEAEHLTWLAGVAQPEAEALMGKKGGEALARDLRALSVGNR